MNQTLYVSNINDKIKKKELRESLYYLFTQYGPVLDIVALKTMKERGQAFVVFEDGAQASQAMRALQGFPFYSKNIKIAYAKSKSNILKIRDGTFYANNEKSGKRTFDDMENEDQVEILLISNLPSTATESSLTTLFQQYDGFNELRMVPGKSDIAFVEFSSRSDADAAKNALNGFEIDPSHKMKVDFAPR